jgi:hypothetical protein
MHLLNIQRAMSLLRIRVQARRKEINTYIRSSAEERKSQKLPVHIWKGNLKLAGTSISTSIDPGVDWSIARA